jgi:ABC-type uncharacterized transport system involved in gliding motility auxiliary subunit
MEASSRSRRNLRLQTVTFTVLFLLVVGLLAWLTTRYNYQADWTASSRHTLSAATTELLEKLDGPVTVTSFSREDNLNAIRKRTTDLVSRYQQVKRDLSLNFTDPDLEPDRVRELGITLEGEMMIEYGGRRENLRTIGEQALTNALQRLARAGERKLVFLEGHGERRSDGEANHDLSAWVSQLRIKGFIIDTLNLTLTPAIPASTAVLVVSSPQVPLLAGEVQLIVDFVSQGGNLLWLSDPGDHLQILQPLADKLGIAFQPGTVVDATGQQLGISHPAFIIVASYPEHPVTQELVTMSLFPRAHGIVASGESDWEAVKLLNSMERAWSETGKMEGNIRYEEESDIPGPITIGLLLTRERSEQGDEPTAEKTEVDEHHLVEPDRPTQRIAVIGDGDFLANAYLGNGANRDLGNRLINWLSHDDKLISIAARTSPDTRLEMTQTGIAVIGFGFLIILPFGLLTSGIVIWLKRRKR